MNRPAHKNKGVNRTKKRTVLPFCFHRQRARRGNGLRLFRRPINGINLIYDKAHRKAGTHFPGKINIGTVSDYINGLPPEIKKLIPDYYIKIHGNKHKEWYSKQ